MRNIALILLHLFCFYNVKAQTRNNVINLTKGRDTIICYQCDIGKSKVVTELTQLIQNKKYAEIKTLMLSGNAAERFLAAVTTKKLFDLKRVTLNNEDTKLIEKIYNSKDTIYTYSNDTYIQIQPIRFFVYNKEERIIWYQTEMWLEKLLK
jgi:hypothetical protein